MRRLGLCCLVLSIGSLGFMIQSSAESLRDALAERRPVQRSRQAGALDEGVSFERGRVAIPLGVRVVRDVPYGFDPAQRMDVYIPASNQASGAKRRFPVLFMVHGGAWRVGDKASPQVVNQKIAHWLPQGVVFISVNYRMLPKVDPWGQVEDVAQALKVAQSMAANAWNADPDQFILMGHSAGAHLVALLSANPGKWIAQGAHAWRGTVALDSASLDVVDTMKRPHLPLFDKAFGNDRDYWVKTSPLEQLSGPLSPFLLVCSSRRLDSCAHAETFARKARLLGGQADVLPEPLSHMEINAQLGGLSAYTERVDLFLKSHGFP